MNTNNVRLDVQALIPLIVDKSKAKDNVRLQACNRLTILLQNGCDIYDVTESWENLVAEINRVLTARSGNLELKRTVGDCIAEIFGYVPDCLGWMIDWTKKNYELFHNKEENTIYISILHNALEIASKRFTEFHMVLRSSSAVPDVLTFLLEQLEASNSQTLLQELLGLSTFLANEFSDEFQPFVKPFIEAVIGWMVGENTQNTEMKCRELLLSLGPHIPNEEEYAKTMMFDFLSDVDRCIEEIVTDNSINRAAPLKKCCSILHVLNTFVEMCAKTEPNNYNNAIFDVFRKALILGNKHFQLLEQYGSPSVTSFFAEYINLFSKLPTRENEEMNAVFLQAESFVLKLHGHFLSCSLIQITCMNFYTKLFTERSLTVSHAVTTIHKLLGEHGCFNDFNPLHRPSASKAFTTMVSSLLLPTSLDSLLASYSVIRQRIHDDISKLSKATEDTAVGNVIRMIESRLCCYISALRKIVTVKNSFLVLGLNPSILYFFCTELPICDDWFIRLCPTLALLIIRQIISHSSSHDYFVATSEWLVDTVRNGMVSESATGKHAQIQITTIAKLLELKISWNSIRSRIAEWTCGLLEKFSLEALERLADRAEWILFYRALFKHQLTSKCDERLRDLSKSICYLQRIKENSSDYITRAVADKLGFLQAKERCSLWRYQNTISYVKCSVNLESWNAWEMTQTRIPASSFGANEFAILSDFLLKRIIPSFKKTPKTDVEWLFDTIQQLYSKSQTIDSKHERKDLDQISIIEKWRWALSQMANYCIENRMKTPLGKPMETFNAFGAELQKLAKEALGINIASTVTNGTENNVKDSGRDLKSPEQHRKTRKQRNDEDDDAEYGALGELSVSEEWWRVRCLLEFVDVLEKLMHNTNNGSFYPITAVSQLARQFFVTNITNCLEWLNRTYSPAIVVAYYNGYYAQVIRFGAAALVDFEKKAMRSLVEATKNLNGLSDSQSQIQTSSSPPALTFAVLGWMARAMAELGAEQSIRGLGMWAKKVYKCDMDWLSGAVEFSAARYESALALIRKSLDNPQLPESAKTILRLMCLDVLVRLRNPILLNPSLCPSNLCIWSEAEKMNGSLPSGFDTDALSRVQQLCSFQKLESLKEPRVKWDLSTRTQHVELQMMQTMRRADVQIAREDVALIGSMVLMADSGQRLHGRIALLDIITNGVLSRMNSKTSIGMMLSPELIINGEAESDMAEKLQLSRRLQLWSDRLSGHSAHRETARLARKTGNTQLATELFEKMRSNNLSDPLNLFVITQEVKMVWPMSDAEKRSLDLTNLFMLVAHHFDLDIQRKGMLAMFAENNVNGPLPPLPPDSSEQLSRTTLRMAEWLKETPQAVTLIQANCRSTNLWHSLEGFSREMNCDIVGSLLASATQTCPKLAKSHLKLADWSYKTAAGSDSDRNSFNTNYHLLLGSDVDSQVLDDLWKLLSAARNVQELEHGVKSLLKQDFSSINLLLGPNSHFINLWSHIRQRQSTFFNIALNGYFSFLNQHDSSEKSSASSTGSVSTTLRILDMLVQHSSLLKPAILAGLEETTEKLWKDIIPQLFSRLSHPSSEVREIILALLSRLCRSSPHSLVYQIVSGSSNSMLMDNNDDVIDETDKDVDYKASEDRSLMIASCRQLETYMQQLYPKLVHDVRQFVTELQKVNLLFEERWLFVLSNLDHEMSRRFEQIQQENAKSINATHLDEKTRLSLVSEKTQLITDSVYSVLNDLYEKTCVQPPTTPNEKSFVDLFQEQIKNAFEASSANKKSPEKAWAPFKQILTLLIQRNARRGTQILLMANISNYLTKLNGTSVPLPGQEDKEFCDVITLQSVESSALVLPTKTRPKKLTFVGNDGKQQAFLFKGQEDLHLDERIMQLLNICNLLLSGSSRRSWPSHTARHYAVTPLGTRSGLIQWVGGATSMFQIYRKWQIRMGQIKQAMEKDGSTANVDVTRPTDMYQKALRAAFTSHSVEPAVVADRSKWPAPILKEVLHSLIKETPKDLLNRELCMRSGNGDTWWRVVSRFARSSAVMSMIGAVLGLGDRHLDNVLINLDTGDIIHIDYNICFDKGRQLRVPETVPFRLTQNFVNALGPTQIEGIFRESCSNVLTILRNNREILLTVLDAFVYDPLVDWAATDHLTSTASVAVTFAVYGADRCSAASKPLARSMFSVRIKELKTPWMKNCFELTEALSSVKTVLEKQSLMNMGGTNNAWASAESLNQQRVECGRRLKAAISMHHNMMKDFKPLLRALATCDDRFVTFAKIYRERFREPLIRGHQFVEGETTDISNCVKLFNVVIKNAHGVYELLLLLDTKDALPSEFTSDAVMTPSSVMPPPPGLEETQNQQQEQNLQAKNVVRRVRARLEGRDPSDAKKTIVSPNEQADTWIRQATSSTLLSMMYEGWTAWV